MDSKKSMSQNTSISAVFEQKFKFVIVQIRFFNKKSRLALPFAYINFVIYVFFFFFAVFVGVKLIILPM